MGNRYPRLYSAYYFKVKKNYILILFRTLHKWKFFLLIIFINLFQINFVFVDLYAEFYKFAQSDIRQYPLCNDALLWYEPLRTHSQQVFQRHGYSWWNITKNVPWQYTSMYTLNTLNFVIYASNKVIYLVHIFIIVNFVSPYLFSLILTTFPKKKF